VGIEGPITNTAEVWASGLYDPDSTPRNEEPGEDDQASVTLNAYGVADLAVTKAANPATIRQGGQVTYTMVVTNNGPDGATGVIVRDQLPAGLTYVSSTGGTYNSKTGAWTVGSLANGQSATLKITVHVGKSGSIVNTVGVVASDQRDPFPANDQDTAGISVSGPTPPITSSGGLESDSNGPGPLALWFLGLAGAAVALVFSVARVRTRRAAPRR
jgi:uncharacterized repeat protein (TIGR01451 family)